MQDRGFGYLVASIVDALTDGREFTVWEADDINMVATPSLASECGAIMYAIASLTDPTGIFHCCGSQPTTRRELAEITCAVFGLDRSLLHFGPPDAGPADLPVGSVPYDTSLSTEHTVRRLGSTPLTTTEIVERFRDERATIAVPAGGTP